MTVPKTCRTCAHRHGPMWFGPSCMFTGLYCEVSRIFQSRCDDDFSGWQPREGVLTRVRNWFKGVGK